MSVFTERLIYRVTSELRYAEGVLCICAERNREYGLDLCAARLAGDDRRCVQINEDRATFRVETDRLEAKQQSADRRLRALLDGEGFRQSA